MLNLSFYSDDWSGYTRLLRDKQAKGDPTGVICAEEAPCLPTTAEINLNEKTYFNLYRRRKNFLKRCFETSRFFRAAIKKQPSI
jgi:hypothetical protein